MSATATVEVVAAVRAQFGSDFVPARVTAEEQVRTFLDAQLGAMDAERIVILGRTNGSKRCSMRGDLWAAQ